VLFEAFKAEVAETFQGIAAALESHEKRLNEHDLTLSGFGAFVSLDEEGRLTLDIEHANEETLRDWAWQFDLCDCNADVEGIRQAFIDARAAEGFVEWEQKNDLPRPAAGDVAAAPAADEVAPVTEADDDEAELSVEQIQKMNWTDLVGLADNAGIGISDLKKGAPQPKVLRTRIIEALTAAQAAVEEGGAPEAEATETSAEGEVPVGAILTYSYEGQEGQGAFVGEDADGDVVLEADGQQFALPQSAITGMAG
jgi:hypothetical protein